MIALTFIKLNQFHSFIGSFKNINDFQSLFGLITFLQYRMLKC